jgi:hypothetical protein
MDNILENHCFQVYESPLNVTEDNRCVRRARLVPLSTTDKALTLATVWGTKFIHKALIASNSASDWKFSCSKPLVLKDSELVYTWEFEISGNVNSAFAALREIDRAPLESKSIEVGEASVPLGPPTASKRNVRVKVTQGGASR